MLCPCGARRRRGRVSEIAVSTPGLAQHRRPRTPQQAYVTVGDRVGGRRFGRVVRAPGGSGGPLVRRRYRGQQVPLRTVHI
jgi:hypothetical protein